MFVGYSRSFLKHTKCLKCSSRAREVTRSLRAPQRENHGRNGKVGNLLFSARCRMGAHYSHNLSSRLPLSLHILTVLTQYYPEIVFAFFSLDSGECYFERKSALPSRRAMRVENGQVKTARFWVICRLGGELFSWKSYPIAANFMFSYSN